MNAAAPRIGLSGLAWLFTLGALGACDGSAPGAMMVPAETQTFPQGRWESLAVMPEMPRFYVGVTAARGQVFVVGGFNDGPESTAVHAFDTVTQTWSALPPLPMAFKMPNVAAVGSGASERLLVLGGLENSSSVEFDFASRTWKTLAPAPVQRGRGTAAVGVHGSTVLLAGGIVRGQSNNNLNTGVRQSDLLAYDTGTDSWRTLTALPVPVGYAMGAVVANKFWVIGGSTGDARTEQVLVYDIAAGTWTSQPPAPRSVSSAAVAVLRGHIIVTGGIATSVGSISPDTMVLNPATATWSTVAPLKTARFGMGAAVVGDRMYVPTGMANGASADQFAASTAMEVYIP